MRELGIQLIPAYSPQARGRSERGFGTWQGRLPQELRCARITTWQRPISFCARIYQRVQPAFHGKAARTRDCFVPLKRKDLDLVFSVQHERVVARDNTVSFANRSWQLERSKLRGTLAGCRVTVHEHLDETLSITFGPHLVGRFKEAAETKGCGNDAATESDKSSRFPQRLGKVTPKSSLTFPHSHSHYCWIDI